jgi:hypothetical protein
MYCSFIIGHLIDQGGQEFGWLLVNLHVAIVNVNLRFFTGMQKLMGM